MQWLAFGLGWLFMISSGGCVSTAAKSTLLATPAKAETLSTSEKKEESFQSFWAKVNEFSAEFASVAYEKQTTDENFVVSPVSVYMALALAAECTAGETRSELLNALDVSYSELTENIGKLFCLLQKQNKEYIGGDVLHWNGGDKSTWPTEDDYVYTPVLQTSNSIWVGTGAGAKQACLDSLANDYYCYTYEADFAKDNKAANNAVRQFVKEQTHGVIDRNFAIDKETAFMIMNTIYLAANWQNSGENLLLTNTKYSFVQTDGATPLVKLVQSKYENGAVYQADTFTSFTAVTENGYRVKFLLPQDGYTVADIFTAENILLAKKAKYTVYDHENKLKYHTRCLFPEFEASYNHDIQDVLKDEFGVHRTFSPEADFSALSDSKALYCKGLAHTAKLKVDRKGIVGAAVTSMLVGAAASDEYTDVYQDFVLDKAFAFVVTDSMGTPLFTGVINEI